MQLEPISPALGVEIRDVDLAELDDNTFKKHERHSTTKASCFSVSKH